MENKEILGYFNNKLTQELDEEDEINMVLSNHKKFKAQNLFNNQNKPLEWLNFFLNDSEIQEIYIQNDRIKSLIILQCLYYLSICNNIFGMKYRIAKPQLGANEGLPLIKNFNSVINFSINNDDKLFEKVKSETMIQTIKSFSPTNENNMASSIKTDRPNYTIRVGVIGCGDIGSFLLKHLILIKDWGIIRLKIIVSTRRPNMVDPEILNNIDLDVEVCLDNEKVFSECDLIFLCLQPHQLDLLITDVSTVLIDKIEKLKKKKSMIYPTIISTLSAIPIDRLKILFPPEVNILRTYLDPKLIKKYSENNFYKDNFGRKKTKIKDTDNILELDMSDFSNYSKENSDKIIKFKKGGIILNKSTQKYSEESFLHLSKLFGDEISSIENLLKIFNKVVNVKNKRQTPIDINVSNSLSSLTFSNELLKSVFGDNFKNIIDSEFDFKEFKFYDESKDRIIDECKNNFIRVIRNIYKNFE